MSTADTTGRVLILDGDGHLRGVVAAAMRAEGHRVRAEPLEASLDELLHAFRPDLVLVGLVGSGRAGLALGRRLRRHVDAGLVFLTDEDGRRDTLLAFELGADDVIDRRVALAELLARTRAVLRRVGCESAGHRLELGDLLIDESAHTVTRDGHPIDLTTVEFALLGALVRRRGHVLSKRQLLAEVWGYDQYDVNLVEVYISSLRRKLDSHGPRLLHTVRGVGYVARLDQLAMAATA